MWPEDFSQSFFCWNPESSFKGRENISQLGNAGMEKPTRSVLESLETTPSFWKKSNPLKQTKEETSETNQVKYQCKAPGEMQAPHPWNSLCFPFCGEHRGVFLLPSLHIHEEALNFPETGAQGGFLRLFQEILPFMLHQLLEAFEWNEKILKKPPCNFWGWV